MSTEQETHPDLSPKSVDPGQLFSGDLLVLVPHSDDGVLACGGTVARLADKKRIFFVYVGDGRGSAGVFLPTAKGKTEKDTSFIRSGEARDALALLGVPGDNISFLNLPDGELGKRREELETALGETLDRIKPAHVLMPFRYDRHPDHEALSRACRTAVARGGFDCDLIEYFVYYRWRMLPGGDIRKCIRPQYLMSVDIRPVSTLKRQALDCFNSQTGLFYPGQSRPVLSEELLTESAQGPEIFLKAPASSEGEEAILAVSPARFRFVHFLEPRLKRKKAQLRFISKKLVLALVACLVALVFAEIVLRLALPPFERFSAEPIPYEGKLLPWIEYSRTTGWINRAGYSGRHTKPGEFDVAVKINSLGLRDREYDYKRREGQARILVLGDSFTFGHGVEEHETYAAQLEDLLKDTEVLNAGVVGTGHDQQLLWLEEEGLKYKPDLILWGFTSADIPRNTVYFRRLADSRTGLDYGKPRFVLKEGRLVLTNVPTPEPERVEAAIADHLSAMRESRGALARFLTRSRALGLVDFGVGSLRERHEQIRLAEAIADRLVGVANEAGVALLIVHLPVEKWLVSRSPSVRIKRKVTDGILDRIETKHASWVFDVRQSFLEFGDGDVEELFIEDGHYSPRGNELVAREIHRELSANERWAAR